MRIWLSALSSRLLAHRLGDFPIRMLSGKSTCLIPTELIYIEYFIFMKLSKKGEYALRSLINLGIAAEVGRSLVQVSELADSEQLPIKFLEQIMQALKEAGMVESVRGKFGGYRLAQPARKIPIGKVVRLIDGPLAP